MRVCPSLRDAGNLFPPGAGELRGALAVAAAVARDHEVGDAAGLEEDGIRHGREVRLREREREKERERERERESERERERERL